MAAGGGVAHDVISSREFLFFLKKNFSEGRGYFRYISDSRKTPLLASHRDVHDDGGVLQHAGTANTPHHTYAKTRHGTHGNKFKNLKKNYENSIFFFFEIVSR